MTIVATFDVSDVSDVFVEDWAPILFFEVSITYSSFKPKILCFSYFFDIREQISIVFHLSLSPCMRVMNKKTLESKASYLELKRYQTYIHLLKRRTVRRGYLQLFSTQTVVTSTEPEAVSPRLQQGMLFLAQTWKV